MRTQITEPIVYKRKPNRDVEKDTRAKYILRWAKKVRAINYKGGRCSRCGDSRVWVLVFHHRDPSAKENAITDMITRTRRWGEIKQELDKCDLVCENCHREIHANSSIENTRQRRNKKICMEFKGQMECQKCGYSKCDWALEFHHNGDKVMGIAKYLGFHSWYSVADLQDKITDELNKCNVYCANCHKEAHFDSKIFLERQNEIEEKAKNLVEKRSLIDKNSVLSSIRSMLDNSGMERRQVFRKVASDFGCSYLRVYEIAREYGIKAHSVDHDLIVKLWNEGKSRGEIISETGYSKSSVLKTIKLYLTATPL